MATIAPSRVGDDLATQLFDADGHVIEDVAGIVERLPEPYRTLRREQLNSGQFGLMSSFVFPPLGYLSTMPFLNPAVEARAPQEDGLGPESWEYFLGAVGIVRTVLYPTVGLTAGRIRDLDYAVAACRAYNDWIAETYVHHPSGRFQAAAILPMQVPAAAAAELRRVSEDLGMCAATLPSHGLPLHLGSAEYFPVYEAAQDLGIALSCHGGIHDGFGFDDFNVFAACHALGHPFSLLISLGGMMFNAVFDRFPGLRVAYLEGGSAWALMAAERFSESFKSTRPAYDANVLRLPQGTSVKDYMSQLMQDGRIVLGCEGGEDQLAHAIDYFGCQPFMYSSDFPHEVGVESCRHELDELNELEIDAEAKALIRGGTARAFYRLD
jgi:predicted TIM-barrel fold metal-dependent hydrolase